MYIHMHTRWAEPPAREATDSAAWSGGAGHASIMSVVRYLPEFTWVEQLQIPHIGSIDNVVIAVARAAELELKYRASRSPYMTRGDWAREHGL